MFITSQIQTPKDEEEKFVSFPKNQDQESFNTLMVGNL